MENVLNLDTIYTLSFNWSHSLIYPLPLFIPLSFRSAGALGFCGAPACSRPFGAESGDDRADPEMQYGSNVRQLQASGRERQTEATAPDNSPRVRLRRRLCVFDSWFDMCVDGRKTLRSDGKYCRRVKLFFLKCSVLVVVC